MQGCQGKLQTHVSLLWRLSHLPRSCGTALETQSSRLNDRTNLMKVFRGRAKRDLTGLVEKERRKVFSNEPQRLLLQVLIKQEIQRKSGYAIQADEEQLRVQLDTIQCELNAPTQFKVSS